jgi:putative membrane protein
VKLVHWLVTVPVALVLAVFAAWNVEPVKVSFWPFFEPTVQLYLVALIPLLLGFFAGAVVTWINGRHWRREARRRARRIEALERELTATQAHLPVSEVQRLPTPGAPRN